MDILEYFVIHWGMAVQEQRLWRRPNRLQNWEHRRLSVLVCLSAAHFSRSKNVQYIFVIRSNVLLLRVDANFCHWKMNHMIPLIPAGSRTWTKHVGREEKEDHWLQYYSALPRRDVIHIFLFAWKMLSAKVVPCISLASKSNFACLLENQSCFGRAHNWADISIIFILL
jgi:hypothetical protein